ncbi:molybdate ABC transporter substrate-binding protein [Streptomyces sp. ST2-7A]|uniref:molybdate ABC transporter substrate-binding protein n=1 Tax=Streptomyces sp. ST2-7A TaxID=2907214 RepID=UPI001F2968E6|nr:molybdate ABC transporter substrate-binding protein [Streptomyces sp. ST2-7A]MCE7080422.1 molybdate ABC transporter substrate-binding protein [Streptomyces sp. ST2-7A]
MARWGAALVAPALAALLAGCGTFTAGGDAANSTTGTGAGSVRVAAASDLRFALDELLEEFAVDHPDIDVEVAYGSSGNFASQLANGAPFDVFLSADTLYTGYLEEEGVTLPDSAFEYAVGRLVVWAPTEGNLRIAEDGMAALTDPGVRKVAVANPEHAPYGRAAMAALEHAGVLEEVEPKLVYGENIAQTAEFVVSGGADAGIIALSLAVAPAMEGRGEMYEIPLDTFPRLNQGGVIMERAEDPEAARVLTGYLTGEEGRDLLERYGFHLPGH